MKKWAAGKHGMILVHRLLAASGGGQEADHELEGHFNSRETKATKCQRATTFNPKSHQARKDSSFREEVQPSRPFGELCNFDVEAMEDPNILVP